MNSYNGFSPTQRMKALEWLKSEIRAGRRQANPQRCDLCGQTRGIIEWHSEDYTSPFGANIGRWGLCYRCHMMVHCRFASPKAWQAYLKAVLAGAIFAPLMTRNWLQFKQDHLVRLGVGVDHGVTTPYDSPFLNDLRSAPKTV